MSSVPRDDTFHSPLVLGLLLAAIAPRAALAQDSWTGSDKALHFAVSASTAGTGYAAGAVLSDKGWVPFVVGGSLALSLGAAKELADMGGRGDASWKDFTWDVAGAVTGLAISYAIHRLFFAEERGNLAARRPSPPYTSLRFERDLPACFILRGELCNDR